MQNRAKRLDVKFEDKQWLRMRAVELLFEVGIPAFLAHMLIVTLVVIGIWSITDFTYLVVWAGLSYLGIILQVAFTTHMRNGEMTPEKSNTAFWFFNAMGLYAGITWAGLFIFMFPEDNYFLAVYLTFAVGGLAMGGVATQHMLPSSTIIPIVLGLGTLAVRYTLADIPNPWTHGFGLLLYSVVLIDLNIRLNKSTMRAARLQLEQNHLLEELSQKTKELEQARHQAEVARHEAETANDAKSRFLAQASHDLRQPLHATNLFLEALSGVRRKAERDEILNRVKQSLNVLTKLFDSLLDVTLLDTGSIEVQPKTFLPSNLIDEVVQDFSMIAEACNVELRTVETSLIVRADPVLLRRMLQNLVSNAIRYSEGGKVLVGCRRCEGKLNIQVCDTGRGIAHDDQQRIFAEFERLDTARIGETAIPGLGLGLAIVKRIAQELDLSVKLNSGEGKGSVFTIGLLDIVDETALTVSSNVAHVQKIQSNVSVFVLDDDDETLRATELILQRWGYNVQSSRNWPDLFLAMPDVIICDYELSLEKNGLDVVKQYHSEVSPHTPVIMVSGHTSRNLLEKTREVGIPLLHKPVLPVQLRSALLSALANHVKPRAAANEAAAARLGSSSVRNIAET